MTERTRSILKKWLWADYLLYDHFTKILDERIENYTFINEEYSQGRCENQHRRIFSMYLCHRVKLFDQLFASTLFCGSLKVVPSLNSNIYSFKGLTMNLKVILWQEGLRNSKKGTRPSKKTVFLERRVNKSLILHQWIKDIKAKNHL